jgi:modulator of drug activity B
MSTTPPTSDNSGTLSRRDMILAGSAMTASLLIPSAGAAAGQAAPRVGTKALIINAHQVYPGISEGGLNRSMAALVKQELEKKGIQVRETMIEKGYAVPEEVEKTLWADIIVVQSPAFWLGAPWIYKKYLDDVFTAGMVAGTMLGGDGRPQGQYGSGGKMQGKRLLLSMTMNAPREAFDDKGQALFTGRSIDEVYFPLSAPYRFCGVEILPAFACFDVMKNPDVANDFERMRARLAQHFGTGGNQHG